MCGANCADFSRPSIGGSIHGWRLHSLLPTRTQAPRAALIPLVDSLQGPSQLPNETVDSALLRSSGMLELFAHRRVPRIAPSPPVGTSLTFPSPSYLMS